jgi:hypothetical protein
VELGCLAKRRDVTENAKISLADLCKKVLRIDLPKPQDIRLGQLKKWSDPNLCEEQLEFAALDAIVGYDLFVLELQKMPDLTSRVKKEDLKPGLKVDIVPPHTPSNTDKIASGFGNNSGDLPAVDAFGEILEAGVLVRLPQSIHPTKQRRASECRDDRQTSCRVRITKVMAPALGVPVLGKFVGGKRQRRVCLGAFGVENFEIVLPLAMLRVHDESVLVRQYGGGSHIDYNASAQRQTKPCTPNIPKDSTLEWQLECPGRNSE